MTFYQKYIPEGQEIKLIIHQHWLSVMDSFVLWLTLWAFLPSFLYFQSERIRDIVPFSALEVWLALVFIKIVYELFNWYNDVWIVTEIAIYDLEWSLLKTNLESIHHENIEGVEVDKHRIWDNIFDKWDLVIHKFWDEELAIYNAYQPYKAADSIDAYIHPDEDEKDKTDKFDMIMDALSWVVHEHLDRHGLLQKKKTLWETTPTDTRYTIDLSE